MYNAHNGTVDTESNMHSHGALQGNATQVENNNAPNPNVTPNRRTRRDNSRKSVKAAIRVASLNMRGYGNVNPSHAQNKWNHVNQIMRDEKVGILLLQETHMEAARHSQVQKLFIKRLHILYSADPESPTRKGGVAIVLNKRFIPSQGAGTIRTEEIVGGRALLLTLNLNERRKLKILAIYAPNDPQKNRDFWNELRVFFEGNPSKKPDLMAGDFNMVEDSLDRLPSHCDQGSTTEALDDLKQLLGLEDGWRNTYPQTLAFTYLQSNGQKSQSRIDRIYSKPSIIKTAREWKISATGMPHADHKMVSVQIVDEDAPSTGSGRWSIPAHLIKDGPLLRYIKERGKEAQQKIDENQDHRTVDVNPQTVYAKFKRDVLDMARKRERAIVPKLIQEIRKCEHELDNINNNITASAEEKVVESEALTQKLTGLKRKQHLKIRSSIAVKNRIEGETMTRSWIQNNRVEKPRDIIYALRKPQTENVNEQDPYEKDSQKMAELARNYHENLQNNGINPNKEIRDQCTEEALASLQKVVTPEERELLKEVIKVQYNQAYDMLL